MGLQERTMSPAPSRLTSVRPVATLASDRRAATRHDAEREAMDAFALTYEGFDPDQEGLREALTSTGNGYLCARGTAEWEDADGVHYPGTYAHGVYNRETTILGGLPVLNEDLVNLANWLVLKLRIDGEDAIRLADVELLAYHHWLDLRNATVLRELRFRDRRSRETTLHSRRFVSMVDVHHAGIEWTLTAENWSGRVEVVSAIDGRVTNAGGGSLPGARVPTSRSGLAEDIRPGGDRPEGAAPPVECLHQPGRAQPGLQCRRADRRGAQPLPDR